MDRFKLKITDYVSFKISKEEFEDKTNKDYPYVQKRNGEDRYYAVCLGCNNPIELVGLYKKTGDKDVIYGRHVPYNVTKIADYNQEDYDTCPYASKNTAHKQNTTWSKNSLIGKNNKRMLKEQFDRIIYILRQQTGANFSRKIAQRMLDIFVGNKGWLNRDVTSDNLPWKFAEALHALPLNGQYIKTSSDLCKSLLKQDTNFFGDQDLKQDSIQVLFDNNKKYKFVFENFKHHLLNGQHIEEKIDFVVFKEAKPESKELYRETLDVDPDYLSNLIKKGNEEYRNHALLKYAEEHIK